MTDREKSSHEIDYEIFGDDMQFVEVELDPHETAVAEAGAMMYMDSGIEMQTIFGDGSEQSNGIMGKIFGAGKRILTGESLFMTAFTNSGSGKQKVSFGAPYPGKIIAMDLSELGGEGLFFANVQGSGKVWLQSLPFSRLADRIISSAPRAGGQNRGEGSILGSLGGMIGGDRKF